MRSLHINSILKSLKVAAILFLIFPKINAFAAISYVDDIDVPPNVKMVRNIPHGVTFNSRWYKNVYHWFICENNSCLH